MLDRVLLAVCITYLLISVQAVPRERSSKSVTSSTEKGRSQKESDKELGEGPKLLIEICALPPVAGNRRCKAFMPRWTYNATLGQCKEYIYGGCGATENLFKSKKDCKDACERPEPEPETVRGSTVSRPALCNLPTDGGPCFAHFIRFGYNKETNRCEEFTYGGCHGNDNNFQDVTECEKACVIPEEPSEKVDPCEGVKCNLRFHQHYIDKGCTPKYLTGACCPSYYECPDPSALQNKCVFNGKLYEAGEVMPEVTEKQPCRAGCFCRGGGRSVYNTSIICANIECPELIGWIKPELRTCKRIYTSPSDCCASGYVNCEQDVEEYKEKRSPMCHWDGVDYVEGQQLYIKSSSAPCQVCRCTPDFKGASGPGCREIFCSFDLPSPGCVPIYEENVCCPYRYKCPAEFSETGIKVLKSGETYSRDGPFITVGVPGKVPVSTLPIAIEQPRTRQSPVANAEAPSKDPQSSQPVTMEGGSYVREGPFITIQVPGKVPISTLPIAVGQPPKRGKVAVGSLNKESGQSEATDRCLQKIDSGKCRASISSYAFDIGIGTCTKFGYGGCGGNDNRFWTLEECETTCKHLMKNAEEETAKPEEKPVLGTDSSVLEEVVEEKRDIASVPVSRSLSVAQPPTKLPSRNLGKETGQLETTERCLVPIVVGPCRGSIPSFGFDTNTGACRPFLYGGCDGNANRFSTLAVCEEACTTKDKTVGDKQDVDSAPVSRMLSVESPLYCLFGDVRFELGDRLAVDDSSIECSCSTPPELTCIQRKKPAQSNPVVPPRRVGGYSDWLPITDEVAEIARSVQSEVESKLERKLELYAPISYQQKVVAGLILKIRISVGGEEFIHLHVHRNLKNEVSLTKVEEKAVA